MNDLLVIVLHYFDLQLKKQLARCLLLHLSLLQMVIYIELALPYLFLYIVRF